MDISELEVEILAHLVQIPAVLLVGSTILDQ